ncbi:MAG: hypothetical protein RL365_1036, partial [Bacteroidota bacterium]
SGIANLYNQYSSPGTQINTTYNQVNFSAGGNITGDFTVGTLSFTSNNTYNFQAGRTVTVTNNIAFNSVCFGGVTIQSATAGTQAFISKSSGIVSGQNLTIKDINATGGATFNAYGSTNMGNNSGWNFIASPALGAIGQVTAGAGGFSVPLVTGAVLYTWTVPAGSTILSGQGTNTIIANVPSGQVCVTASNGCGAATLPSCYTNAVDYISLNNMGVVVNENFNTLANTATSSSFPVGWRIYETGTNADINYTAATGASNTGDSYSLGLVGSSLRTLGALRSGSLASSFGAKFLNNTNASINSITVTYVGETWRVGNTNRTDKIDFQYSLNATDLSNGTWIDVDSLDYENIPQANTASGSVLHSQQKNYTIFGLNIPAGAYFLIKWIDADATGSDDAIGINDFSIKPCFTVASPTTTAQSFCGSALVSNLVATGNNISWYTSAIGNAPLLSNNAVTNATYFASQTLSGCESQRASSAVTINALPVVSAGSNQAVCTGTAVTLSGSGASTYAWNNNVQDGVAFTPNATQTYTVTGTDANGCTNTAQVQVAVNALPVVSGGQSFAVCQGTSVILFGSGAQSYTWNNGVVNSTPFVPILTQSYTVVGTDINGCSNTAQVTVTVNPLPIVSGGGNQNVCAGNSVTLSGSGANNYTWNNNVQNGVAFTPNATQTYTVTGTDANGCTNTAQVQVAVNALPVVSAGANQTICSGANVTLNGSGATSYAWNNNVQDGVAFTPNATQTYTVTGTDANGCTNTAQVLVTVNPLPQLVLGNNINTCVGSPVTLSATGAVTYNWSGGVQNGVSFIPNTTQYYVVTGVNGLGCSTTDSILVSVHNPTSSTINITACNSYSLNGDTFNQSGTYIQTIQNVMGCDSTITLNLVINVPPLLPIITVNNDVTLTTLTQPNVTYQWVFCNTWLPINNQTDTSFTSTINGQFAVIVSNGCGSVTSECVTIDNVNLTDLTNNELSIYPNPTSDIITIEGLTDVETSFYLMDTRGRIVKNGYLNSSAPQLSLFNLSTGIYWLHIIGNKPIELIKQ